MINHADKLRTYFDAYEAGIYTEDETVDATIALLVESQDYSILWGAIPDWAQLRIWIFLNSGTEPSVLADSSPISYTHVNPGLTALKSWLITVR